MKNAFTVFKKEFYRVMSDKRLIFTTIIMPGLMIFIMYSFMGNAISGEISSINDHTIQVYEVNIPDSIKTMIANDSLETDPENKRTVDFIDASDMDFDEIEIGLLDKSIDVYIVFPEEFESTLLNYQDIDYEIPNIDTTYNPGERNSESGYYHVMGYLSAYSNSVSYDRHGDALIVYNMNVGNDTTIVVNEEKAQGQNFAMLLPMLIIIFLFSGAMSIGPDSIAGEKERGTIATLLVTPIKRSELAIGKVLSLSAISLMSATSSFIGILFSLDKLLGADGADVDTSIYGAAEFLQLFFVLLGTVLVIVGIISVVSAYAKTIKEASMFILPFYFISMFVGISTMFTGEAASNPTMYLIPIYSSVHMIISILTFEVNAINFAIMVSSSVVYVVILIYIMNKLFQSEKVMFSK